MHLIIRKMFVRAVAIILHFDSKTSRPFNDNFIALARKRLNALRNWQKSGFIERRLRHAKKSLGWQLLTFVPRKLHRSVARGSFTIFDPLARREEEIKALARNL